MLCMLNWLGIKPSYSRPRVSDDNAYPGVLLKTAKCCPEDHGASLLTSMKRGSARGLPNPTPSRIFRLCPRGLARQNFICRARQAERMREVSRAAPLNSSSLSSSIQYPPTMTPAGNSTEPIRASGSSGNRTRLAR